MRVSGNIHEVKILFKLVKKKSNERTSIKLTCCEWNMKKILIFSGV